jgi:uncharacterized membrane protein YtjA (UPF0391 family)
MLKWAAIFFVISIIAGVLGFTNVAAGARSIAKVLFYIALAIFVVLILLAIGLGAAIF